MLYIFWFLLRFLTVFEKRILTSPKSFNKYGLKFKLWGFHHHYCRFNIYKNFTLHSFLFFLMLFQCVNGIRNTTAICSEKRPNWNALRKKNIPTINQIERANFFYCSNYRFSSTDSVYFWSQTKRAQRFEFSVRSISDISIEKFRLKVYRLTCCLMQITKKWGASSQSLASFYWLVQHSAWNLSKYIQISYLGKYND